MGRIDLPEGWADIVDGRYVLRPGIHDVLAPIRITGGKVHLGGTRVEGRVATTLRRGRSADGELYRGHLFEIADAEDVRLSDMDVDGGRFRDGLDLRHPLDSDRSSPRFLSAQTLDAPACFEPAAWRSAFAADVSVHTAAGLELDAVTLRNAIGIGMALGPGCRDVKLRNCAITASGDYGLWIGGGLPGDVGLPVPEALAMRLPRHIGLEACLIERCGAAGLYIEALDVTVSDTTFLQNHFDAPYDDESGQIVIDYKAGGTRLTRCHILAGGLLTRRAVAPRDPERLLGTFGIEASGSDLTLKDCVISGNSREGIQLMGARNVTITGRSRIAGNQLAALHPLDIPRPLQNITATTTAHLRALGAVASGLTLNGLRCENGVVLWPHPSAPDARFDDLTVADCDLSGPGASGVFVVEGAGGSPRGRNWQL